MQRDTHNKKTFTGKAVRAATEDLTSATLAWLRAGMGYFHPLALFLSGLCPAILAVLVGLPLLSKLRYEPSLGLAPIIVKMTFELIRTLNDQQITVLLVEQNIRQALKVAQRATILKVSAKTCGAPHNDRTATKTVKIVNRETYLSIF